ncbi:MAG: motility protein A [Phycisphaerales bacterium]
MDINTLIGSILGWVLIVGAILIGGSGLAAYVDPPSMVIVVGGMFCATLVAFPMSNLLQLPKVLLKTVFAKSESAQELIETLVNYAEIARREGILSLESMTNEIDNEFIVRGIQMAVDGTDPDLIEAIMEAELENQITRHQQGKGLLDALGRYAPAFGMIGTLIGLVAMLANMEDPSKIGAGMAAALLTTLYGALLSNLMFLPMSDKLAQRAADEVLLKTIIIRGVMSIQSGDNPRIVAQKLETYLPPSTRPQEDDEAAMAA